MPCVSPGTGSYCCPVSKLSSPKGSFYWLLSWTTNCLLHNLDSLRKRWWARVRMRNVYWGLTPMKGKGRKIALGRANRIAVQTWWSLTPVKPKAKMPVLEESCVVYYKGSFIVVLLRICLMPPWEAHDLGAKAEADIKEWTLLDWQLTIFFDTG